MNKNIDVSVRITADGRVFVTQARAAKEALGGLADSARKTNTESAALTNQVSRQGAALSQATGQTNEHASSLSKLNGATLALTASISAGIAAAAASFKGFVGFDKQLTGVSTLIEGTAEEMVALESASRSLGATYGKMPVEQAKTFYQVISSGVTDVTKATELLDEANKLSVAGMADLFATADSMTSIMNAYGTGVKSAADVSDILFIGTLAGKTTIDELASSLGRVAPLAESVGVGFDELTSAISALTLGGISTAEAVTGVRAILAAVIKPSSEAVEVANALGIEFDSAALKVKGFGGFMEDLVAKTQGSQEAMGLLFGGVEAIVPALALAGKAGDSYNSIMQQMAERTGATQTAFDKMAASPGFKVDRLMASISDAAITLGDSLAGYLIPAAEGATKALNNFFGVKNLSAIDKQKALIDSLAIELDSLNNRKHIPLVGDLLFDKKQADLLGQRIEDARGDLARLEESTRGSTEASKAETKAVKDESAAKSGLNEVNNILAGLKDKGTQKTKDATNASEREAQRAVESSNRIVAALKIETEQIGLNAVQKKMMAAASEAARAPTKELAQEIMASAAAWAQATQQQEESLSLQRSQKEAADERARAEQQAAQKVRQDWRNTWGQVEQNAKTAFIQFAAHGKSAMQSIGESIKFSIIDVLYQLTVRKWIINIGTSMEGMLAGSMAGGSAGGGGALNALFNGAGLINAGKTIFNGFSSGLAGGASSLISGFGRMLGSSALSSFGAGLSGVGTAGASAGIFSAAGGAGTAFIGGAGTAIGGTGMGAAASMGSMLSAAAGPAMIAFAVTQGLKMLAGDKRLGGGFGNVMNKIGDIPILGDLMPVIPLINALFGRGPLKQKETSLTGAIGLDGFESGMLQTRFKAKGGLLRSNKTDFARVDAVTGDIWTDNQKQLGEFTQGLSKAAKEIFNVFNDTARQTSTTLKQVGVDLGLSNQALDGFQFQLNLVSEKGKALTEEQISKEIENMTDAMARKLLPQVDDLAKRGETALQTVSRLGSEFTSLVDAAMLLGNSVADSKAFMAGTTFAGRTAFVDAAGGTDTLMQNAQFFAENFLTDAERLAPAQERLNNELGRLGLSTDLTKDQFGDLVQSFGHVNGISEEMLQALLNLAPAFVTVRNATEAMTTASEDAARVNAELARTERLNAAGTAYSALQKSVDAERKRITNDYNDKLDTVNTRIQNVTDSIGKLKTLSDALKSTVSQIRPLSRDQAKQQIQDAINAAKAGKGLPDAKDLQEALGVLGNQSPSGFSGSFEFAREQAKTANLVGELGGLADAQLTLEERSLKALEAQRDRLDEGFRQETERLDALLEQGQKEIDTLNGLNTSILSLTQAIGMLNLRSIQASGGASIIDPLTGTAPVAGNPKISDKDIRDFVNTKGRTEMEIYNAAKQNGVSFAQYAAATGAKLEDLYAWADKNKLPRFASGGFHRGGLRIVGERGPELEFTGPSRITSNNDLAKMLNNHDVVDQIKILIQAVGQSTEFNRRVSTKLDDLTIMSNGMIALRTAA